MKGKTTSCPMAERNLDPVFSSCLRNPVYMRRSYVELFHPG
jgi:hypothetical protein